MPREIQTPDLMFKITADGPEILFGTAMHRVQTAIDSQPVDQESTEFYAGDIRDCCLLCESDKVSKSLKEKTKGMAAGALVSLVIKDVQSLVSKVLNPIQESPTPA